MDFQTAVRTVLQQKYADFNGRAPRSEFWWFYLAVIIAYIVVGIVGGLILGRFAGALIGLLGLAIIVPSLALTARRLHDVDKSGWWMLIAITGIGGLVLLYWYVQPGTSGPNRFGEDPLPQAIAAT
ncbi:MAG: DUF805 domain-containing protein [Sphingomonadales bacterium]